MYMVVYVPVVSIVDSVWVSLWGPKCKITMEATGA